MGSLWPGHCSAQCCPDLYQLQPAEELVNLNHTLFLLPSSDTFFFSETCAADTGLNKWQLNTDFTSGSSAFTKWNTTAGSVESTSLGAKFTISEQGDAPTIESDFYIFFGRVDVKFRAANGTGIISTAVMESDDLDEIDWVSGYWKEG